MASTPFTALSLSHSRARCLALTRPARPSLASGLAGPVPGARFSGGAVISARRNLGPTRRNLRGTVAESSDKREPMVPPYNVLITGSTKGIGYAFAKEFIKAGDNVVICSRSAERVESALQKLREEFGEHHVWF